MWSKTHKTPQCNILQYHMLALVFVRVSLVCVIVFVCVCRSVCFVCVGLFCVCVFACVVSALRFLCICIGCCVCRVFGVVLMACARWRALKLDMRKIDDEG